MQSDPSVPPGPPRPPDRGDDRGPSPRPPRRASPAGPFLLLAQLAACAICGYYLIFSLFSLFDDEGYLLIGTKLFLEGRPLYDDVFSLYGPLPYLVKWGYYSALDGPVSHDSARFFSLACWLIAAGASALAVGRLAHSSAVATVALAASFHVLSPIVFCPGHPQDLSAALLGLAVLASTSAGSRRWEARFAIVPAAIGGLLIATRINVGVFLLMALGATMLVFGPQGRWARALGGLYLLAMLATPALLIRPLLGQSWCAQLLGIELLAILSVVLACHAGARPELFRPRHIVEASAAVILSLVAVCVLTWLRGTSVRGVIDGVFLRGPRLGLNYVQPMSFGPAARPAPIAAVLVSAALASLPRLGDGGRRLALILSVPARIGVGLFVMVGALSAGKHDDFPILLAWGPSFAFLLLAPGGSDARTPPETAARAFLAFLSVTELLWVFPVAGDQRAFASFPAVAAAVLSLDDGLAVLASGAPRASRLLRPAARAAGAAIVLALTIGQVDLARRNYLQLTPLDLPGAARVRSLAKEVGPLRDLTRALSHRPGTFITMPGLNSFYLWSGHEPPTGLNLSNWTYFLSVAEQRSIIARLEERPEIALVFSPALLDFWYREADGATLDRSPLVHYLLDEFRHVARFDPYILAERRSPSAARRPAATPAPGAPVEDPGREPVSPKKLGDFFHEGRRMRLTRRST